MRKFQIRDGPDGISLYVREHAHEALLDFFADRRRGELRGKIERREDGSAAVMVDGSLFTAVEIVDEPDFDPSRDAKPP